MILKFTPVQLCLLNSICRLFIAAFVKAVDYSGVAFKLGRSNTCILFHLLSAFFTLGIYGGGAWDPGTPPVWLSTASFLLRYGFMQARDPILNAIVNDVVPPEQKSKWNSFNSLRSLSFSGSALIGGLLADSYGYEFSFFVTVITLFVCTILLIPGWYYFPKAEGTDFVAENGSFTSDIAPQIVTATAGRINGPTTGLLDAGSSELSKPGTPTHSKSFNSSTVSPQDTREGA